MVVMLRFFFQKQKTVGSPVEWCVLICDNPNAPVVEKVKFYEVHEWSHQLSEFKDKKEFEKNIKKVLTFYNVDGIVLSGYMKIIGSEILNTWKSNIINLHPSLLPFFQRRLILLKMTSNLIKM